MNRPRQSYVENGCPERMTTEEVRKELAETLNRVAYGNTRVTVTRRGKDLAAMVPIEDLNMLKALEEWVDLSVVREALAEAEREGTTSWSDLKQELGL